MPSATHEDYVHLINDQLRYLLGQHGEPIPNKGLKKAQLCDQVIELNFDWTYVGDFWKYDTKFETLGGMAHKSKGDTATIDQDNQADDSQIEEHNGDEPARA